jgi:hypothetical protein
MQKFLLIVALVASAILTVEGHVKLHTPMSRIPFTDAEKTARYYGAATSMGYEATGPNRACGTGPENVRDAASAGNKKLRSNDQVDVKVMIAVNHQGAVYYGVRQYVSATDNTPTDYELGVSSRTTAGLGVLAFQGESNSKLFNLDEKAKLIIPPQYACKNCALYVRYFSTATETAATGRMWNSCSDVEILLPEYGLRIADTANAQGTVIDSDVNGKQYFQLSTGMAGTTTKGANIKHVDYQVDGVAQGTSSVYPFALEFDSVKFANGNHELKATVVHLVALTIEGVSTTVTVTEPITTSNTCSQPLTRTCQDGSLVEKQNPGPDGCNFPGCPLPFCRNGNGGQKYTCKAGLEKEGTFATLGCGPVCDDLTCCDPPPQSCGAYKGCIPGGDNPMYQKPNASEIECGKEGKPDCNDDVCCAPPGRCTDQVCQIAAQTLTLETGSEVKQVFRDIAPDRYCDGAICPPTECCTVPADCSQYTCDGVPKTIVAGLYLSCQGENCTEDECCDPQFTCSQYDCPGTQHLIADAAGKQCSAVTCKEPGYCCEPNRFCTDFPCADYNMPAPDEQGSILCERSRSASGFGEIVCGVSECCVNTLGNTGGLNGAGMVSDDTMVIAGVLLGVLVFVVGGFLVWKKQADASRTDQTRNMLDGAKVNAVQMRAPPVNRQSVNAIYNTGGGGGGNNGYV